MWNKNLNVVSLI